MLTIRKRGKIWHARGTIYIDGKGRRVAEFSTRYEDQAEAERFVRDWERDQHVEHLRRKEAERTARTTFSKSGQSSVLPSWAQQIWLDAKKRAAKSGVLFDLGEADMAALVNRAGGQCEVSEIEFSDGKVSQSYHRPFIPSLDRIRASDGYTLNNTRLVCVAINVGINQWGEDVFLRVCRSVARSNRHRGTYAKSPKRLAQIVPNLAVPRRSRKSRNVPKCGDGPMQDGTTNR